MIPPSDSVRGATSSRRYRDGALDQRQQVFIARHVSRTVDSRLPRCFEFGSERKSIHGIRRADLLRDPRWGRLIGSRRCKIRSKQSSQIPRSRCRELCLSDCWAKLDLGCDIDTTASSRAVQQSGVVTSSALQRNAEPIRPRPLIASTAQRHRRLAGTELTHRDRHPLPDPNCKA
jgi:hypothetical protein